MMDELHKVTIDCVRELENEGRYGDAKLLMKLFIQLFQLNQAVEKAMYEQGKIKIQAD